MVEAQRVCSYSEYMHNGVCFPCPLRSYGMDINDRSCYSCDYPAQAFINTTPNQMSRFLFLCNGRYQSFNPVQSGSGLFAENKFALEAFRKQKASSHVDQAADEEAKQKEKLKVDASVISMIGFGFLLLFFIAGCIFGLVRHVNRKCRRGNEEPAPPEQPEQPAQPLPVLPLDENSKWKLETEELYRNLLIKLKLNKDSKVSFNLTECAICQENFNFETQHVT